jgi:phosphoglycolate phosphatase
MRLVIFDCDGTLVDSQHMICLAMQSAFAQLGLVAPARTGIMSVIGLSLGPAIARLAPDLDLDQVERLGEAYKDAFAELRADPAHDEPLFPGALKCVTALAGRGDVLLGVATGKSRRGVERLFDRHGLHPHFLTIQTADTHPSKPHPSMVRQAMAEAGVNPEDTAMVGDTTYDIEMGLGAGVTAIGVGWGYHPPAALAAAGAHEVVAQYADLNPALDRLLLIERNAT